MGIAKKKSKSQDLVIEKLAGGSVACSQNCPIMQWAGLLSSSYIFISSSPDER